MLDLDDTICAPATANGYGLRGVVRLSGPKAIEILASVFSELSEPLPNAAPRAMGAEIVLEGFGAISVTAFVWPNARSYTRQKSGEIHFPTSPVIREAIIAQLLRRGARLARPGEFTLRAFLAGRVDLSQAEAILGVIHAESDTELQTGLRQLAGGVFGPIHTVREDLLCLLADIEAGLDFVEEDIEFVTQADALGRLQSHLATVGRIREQLSLRSADSAGWRVALVGPPNVGKSSLFNALTGRNGAIVHSAAGTTRDVVEAVIDIGEHRVRLFDLAGLDDAAALAVDALAQQKAHETIAEAHLVLRCGVRDDAWRVEGLNHKRVISVATKCDLDNDPTSGIKTSSATGEGIEALRSAMAAWLDEAAESKSELFSGTALFSAASLYAAYASLVAAKHRLEVAGPDEAFAIDLRLALDHLGEITGAVLTDDILDRVFSRFCIGK
jgi:tRNA modification GTPase